MKSKQLANVLIKVLGLSVCLYAIPSCVSGILRGISQFAQFENSQKWLTVIPVIAYGIGAAVQAVIGLVIIAKSQNIAGWMFKDDDE
jgi:hypothetical protein